MHAHDLSPWNHSHDFDAGSAQGERALRWVLAITLATMVLEIAAGTFTGSLALTADGWHMGTHAAAFGVSLYAYWLARKHRGHARYAWGTWKIEVLGGFASSVALAIVALIIAVEAVQRLLRPEPIDARDALIVAVIGFAVNIACALLLKPPHAHTHDNSHDHAHDDDHDHHDAHDHGHHHHDHNLHAAFTHVLADAATSVAAIIALAAAWLWGATWLDPLVGLAASAVIAWWAVGLMRSSSRVLLDAEMDAPITTQAKAALQSDGDAQVADLHVWRVGRERYAMIACIVADAPQPPDVYRARLAHLPQLAHVSIEVNRCRGGVHPH
ncbi:MAG: CDF family Co(II)/Ni(II) efflux transporter DmeF [Burkholderiaceae bacterium]